MLPAVLALTALPANPDVLDVDPLTGPYVEIRDAVAAAAPGDVIRVASGSYGHFGLIGKGVTIVPRSPQDVVDVVGTIRVQALPASQTAVLAGLRARLAPGDLGPVLRVASTAGAVRVEDCSFRGASYWLPIVQVSDAGDLALVDCDVLASDGRALAATRSVLHLYGGHYTAGVAPGDCFDGPDAVLADHCALTLSGALLQGGLGGPEDSFVTVCNCGPGRGGAALHIEACDVELLDTTLVPGSPGNGFWCAPGVGGWTIVDTGGSTIATHLGRSVDLGVSPRLVTEGYPIDVHMTGEPGEPLVLVVGPEARLTVLAGITGDLLVGGGLGAVRRAGLGLAPVSLQLTAPQLAPFGVEQLHLQALQIRPSAVVLDTPRVVTVLDASW